MAFIDVVEKITLTATEDYSVNKTRYAPSITGNHFIGYDKMRIVKKGEQYEVPASDWVLYKGSGIFSAYLIRKIGNKKAFRVSTLYFLSEPIIMKTQLENLIKELEEEIKEADKNSEDQNHSMAYQEKCAGKAFAFDWCHDKIKTILENHNQL